MSKFIKYFFLCVSILCLINQANAAPPSIDEKKLKLIAEECRQLALKVDLVSRYQERPLCAQSLDGEQIYFASKYILINRISEAMAWIDNAIIQTSFAIDIKCHGVNEMQDILFNLQSLKRDLIQLS